MIFWWKEIYDQIIGKGTIQMPTNTQRGGVVSQASDILAVKGAVSPIFITPLGLQMIKWHAE